LFLIEVIHVLVKFIHFVFVFNIFIEVIKNFFVNITT